VWIGVGPAGRQLKRASNPGDRSILEGVGYRVLQTPMLQRCAVGIRPEAVQLGRRLTSGGLERFGHRLIGQEGRHGEESGRPELLGRLGGR